MIERAISPAGENRNTARFLDLCPNSNGKRPVGTGVCVWGGEEFVRLLGWRIAWEQTHPDTCPDRRVL